VLFFARRPVKQGNVANPLHEVGISLPRDLGNHLVTMIAVDTANADLDQFMVFDRLFEFFEHRFTDTGVADHHHGLKVVAEATQVFLLRFG